EVSRVATEMIDGISLSHPWLGITDAGDLPSVLAHKLGLDGGVQAGAVANGSPAAQAGMRANDILTSLGGKTVTSTGALLAEVSTCIPGTAVPMTYVHDGKTVQTTVKMAEEPRDY
ncbi:MAG TPA: PDZ domain-containing protein, partial [Acidimicrobiales bacterium]|nr:PDZ domain-containing protein [Acidimicrobiales bacterium]